MDIHQATRRYERWLAARTPLIPRDLALKHEQMGTHAFAFFRATFYRWAQLWDEHAVEWAAAPRPMSVGDLHIDNFGTWRDAEGRLVWGINDFDEAWRLPYTFDLVRLATSTSLAISHKNLEIDLKRAAKAILDGYRDALDIGGRPLVLAEGHKSLRLMAEARLHKPRRFWHRLTSLPTLRGRLPTAVHRGFAHALPEPDLPYRPVRRVAGLGHLGRQRFVALAEYGGGTIAREAKAMAPSAVAWARGHARAPIHCQKAIESAIRCHDPFVRVKRGWLLRRLAPDCARIELSGLPRQRDATDLLEAMGRETANMHLGTVEARALLADLHRRSRRWLYDAARMMRQHVEHDFSAWHSRR